MTLHFRAKQPSHPVLFTVLALLLLAEAALLGIAWSHVMKAEPAVRPVRTVMV